jgi:hypothetical protein
MQPLKRCGFLILDDGQCLKLQSQFVLYVWEVLLADFRPLGSYSLVVSLCPSLHIL